MPLHLLHHKSYHVYSTANIERVRRDEAAARAKEEAEEQRMQEADAEHRIRVLRARAGADTRNLIEDKHELPDAATKEKFVVPQGSTKINENEATIVERPPPAKRRKASPVLTGADGHINLFSDIENPKQRSKAEKNPEHEAEKKAKEDKLEAQYTMSLGKPAEELKPWYSTLDMVGEVKGRIKTDREMRKDERNKDWGDPLVAIKRGVRGVKEASEARQEWKRTRELEVGAAGLRALGTETINVAERARDGSREYRRKQDRSRETHHDRSRHGGRSRSRSKSKSGYRHYSHKHRKSESSIEISHRHRQRHRSSRSRSPHRGQSPRNDLLEKLRRERDQREKVEKEKTEAMLIKEKEYRLPGWKAADGGRYSSQFGIGEVRRR